MRLPRLLLLQYGPRTLCICSNSARLEHSGGEFSSYRRSQSLYKRQPRLQTSPEEFSPWSGCRWRDSCTGDTRRHTDRCTCSHGKRTPPPRCTWCSSEPTGQISPAGSQERWPEDLKNTETRPDQSKPELLLPDDQTFKWEQMKAVQGARLFCSGSHECTAVYSALIEWLKGHWNASLPLQDYFFFIIYLRLSFRAHLQPPVVSLLTWQRANSDWWLLSFFHLTVLLVWFKPSKTLFTIFCCYDWCLMTCLSLSPTSPIWTSMLTWQDIYNLCRKSIFLTAALKLFQEIVKLFSLVQTEKIHLQLYEPLDWKSTK